MMCNLLFEEIFDFKRNIPIFRTQLCSTDRQRIVGTGVCNVKLHQMCFAAGKAGMRSASMETSSDSNGISQQSFEEEDQGSSHQYRKDVILNMSVPHKTND